MKRMMLAALLLSACAQEAGTAAPVENGPPTLEAVNLPITDQAGNRMESWNISADGARLCSSRETWCLHRMGEDQAGFSHNGGAPRALPGIGVVWSNAGIIVSPDSAIVFLARVEEQSYSGGGASATHVAAFRLTDTGAEEIAVLPMIGSATIRACFDQDDQTQRAGACADEYSFMGRVRLDDSVTSGPPRIVLETAAGTYPGRVTRGEDSLERPPLTAADLVWVKDDVCSFRRTFSQSPAGPYAPDADLPACSDYLEP
jgi:hypothetical protein